MPRLKLFAASLALLAVSVVTPAPARDQAGTVWLFVLQGEVTEISDSTMILRPDPRVVAFTDRPNRQVRLADLRAVASAWGEGATFDTDPPNASLVDETDGDIGIIEIIDLSVDADGVTATFRRLEGALPAVGDRIALTIDGAPCSGIVCF